MLDAGRKLGITEQTMREQFLNGDLFCTLKEAQTNPAEIMVDSAQPNATGILPLIIFPPSETMAPGLSIRKRARFQLSSRSFHKYCLLV